MKLKYGMVGGGQGSFIGAAHRHAINLDGMAELAAGCFSRDYGNTLATGKELGLPEDRLYKSFDQMARAEAKRADGIDFVVVVTPNVSHYEICKAFLQEGIHVACDKPLCVNARQAAELEELAEKKGLLFLVTYVYMGHVTAKHAAEIIASGQIGRVRAVMAEYPQGWLAFEGSQGGKQGAWRMDPAQSGGTNCLGDLGTHVENAVTTMTALKSSACWPKWTRWCPAACWMTTTM